MTTNPMVIMEHSGFCPCGAPIRQWEKSRRMRPPVPFSTLGVCADCAAQNFADQGVRVKVGEHKGGFA